MFFLAQEDLESCDLNAFPSVIKLFSFSDQTENLHSSESVSGNVDTWKEHAVHTACGGEVISSTRGGYRKAASHPCCQHPAPWDLALAGGQQGSAGVLPAWSETAGGRWSWCEEGFGGDPILQREGLRKSQPAAGSPVGEGTGSQCLCLILSNESLQLPFSQWGENASGQLQSGFQMGHALRVSVALLYVLNSVSL